MTLTTFKLPNKPRRLISPRQISKQTLLNAPKTRWEEDETKRALDDWHDTLKPALEDVLRYVHPPTLPKLRPTMPPDVTRITNDELGTLHGQFVKMCEWMDWRLAEAEALMANQAALLLHVKAEVRLKKIGTVDDKTAKTLNDERFIQQELLALQHTAKRDLIRARLRGYERCASALSREMTRRLPQDRHI